MIVDCGGGTIDIAVHRWDSNMADKTYYVDEIHKVHGGPCGSFAVNKKFEVFMKELLNLSDSEIAATFEMQWNKLLYDDFERTKCMFGPNDKEITVTIPEKICKYIKKAKATSIKELVKRYPKKSLQWDDDEDAIVIPYDFMLGFFEPIFNQIIDNIDVVLKAPECKSVTKIMLVGGFAVSQHLYNAINKHFPNYSVERGKNPWLSVLLGAIKFGKNHAIIRSRIMCQTIGIETWDTFIPGYHSEKYKKLFQGKSYCTKIFTKCFEVNERISSHNIGKELSVTPASNEHNICAVNVYSSYDEGVKYVDDISCYVLGTLMIEAEFQGTVPREVKIQIDATGPEITVTAKCNGNSQQLKLNLLK